MSEPTITECVPWSAHPAASPPTEERDGTLVAAANGTRTCTGGWLIRYAGIEGGRTYLLRQEAQVNDVGCSRDVLECVAIWGEGSDDGLIRGCEWDYLLPNTTDDGEVCFERRMTAPEGADCLTIRCTFRWSATGESVWSLPRVEALDDGPSDPGPVRVAVVTGHAQARSRSFASVADNVEFYASLCEAACEHGPQLIVLPEVALQWGLSDHAIDTAVPVPGPETEVFSAIAARHGTRICLGLFERDGDAVHNSAILIGPSGKVDGRYRKVHLAVGGENTSGILPGDGFPVFDTEIGRIGCNICMDSSAAESSRMVGLNGADFLLLPIMGDHRASRWNRGGPIFNESRWLAMMRTRAMDNQLCMVVARNMVQGSCVIDRKGEVLAWNEGDQDFVLADVRRADGYRMWNGACFRDVNWMQRRPHVYGAFVEPENRGSLR